MKRVIEYKCNCRACSGTGIYVGMAERDGSGVVCHSCNGSGFREERIEYEDFEGRVPRHDVSRVFENNPGIAIGVNTDRELRLSTFGGMSYKDWAKDEPFPPQSEMRQFSCPAWWYQSVDYKKKPNWDECISCGTFSQCENFPTKVACWERFDIEQAED